MTTNPAFGVWSTNDGFEQDWPKYPSSEKATMSRSSASRECRQKNADINSAFKLRQRERIAQRKGD